MPELPEVETTRRGIEPHILHKTIERVIIRESRLRWPINRQLNRILQGSQFRAIDRRGKYILLSTQAGTLILHLGMSGSLRIVDHNSPHDKHDHVDIVFSNGKCLRFHDPRKFGAILWTREDPGQHKLLSTLGPEPLAKDFSADYLFTRSRGRKTAIKNLIMDSHIVVGIGNIYACEALFLAGIRPGTASGRLSRRQCQVLVEAIRQVLQQAIGAGGTTLRDFTNSEGKPGYFKQRLHVYGRENQPCSQCAQLVKRRLQAGRSTFYCPVCQR